MVLDGRACTTESRTTSQSGENPSPELRMLLELLLKRLPSRPNSPTLPSESALECSSRRTTRESLASYPEMVVCPSSMRTTKSSLEVSVEKVTQWEICPECVSESSRSPAPLSSPFGSTRRKSQSSES